MISVTKTNGVPCFFPLLRFMHITGLFQCPLPRTSLVRLILYQERRLRKTTTYLFQAFAGEKDQIWLFQLAQMGLSKFFSWFEIITYRRSLKPPWYRVKQRTINPRLGQNNRTTEFVKKVEMMNNTEEIWPVVQSYVQCWLVAAVWVVIQVMRIRSKVRPFLGGVAKFVYLFICPPMVMIPDLTFVM